ncbi:MAG TPA: hypothetical protein VN794_19745 [Methylomirabilota bacterium]|nr:hypothetical protein [Methylomirabilota bacterium]
MATFALLFSPTMARAGETLVNAGLEAGLNNWTVYSPVSWNTSIQTGTSRSGSKSFRVYGAWASPQPNWMGILQKAVSAPGCVYQAKGYIFSPSTDWIGKDSDQNYAWVEVTFRNSANTILALYRSATFDSTSPQDTWVDSPVTNQMDLANYTVTNTVSSLEAPAGTAMVQFQVVFEQANWGNGVAFFDDLSLNQIAGPVPPTISGITPDGGQLFYNTATSFSFNVSSSTTDINAGGIRMSVNGIDVGSQLQITGTPRNQNVSYALRSNELYNISITVTDAVNFYSVVKATFDTFSPNSYVWEAEDYDFNGGQFFDNPVLSSWPQANSYYGLAGVNEVDYLETGDSSGDKGYRLTDAMATGVANGDVPRQKFLDAVTAGDPAVVDYKVGWFDGGEWVNYTRTFPAGKFNVFARVDGGAGTGIVDLSRVTAGVGTSNQTVVRLGTFTFEGRGWSTFDWVPLTDTYGNMVAVDLGGVGTLRATTHGGADLNFFLIVPAKLDRPVISGIYPDGAKLFQPTNQFAFTASSPVATIPAANIQVTVNGTNVSSQLVITGSALTKSVVLPGLQTNQVYNVVVSVTDANGSSASSTLKFDTYVPSFLWEAEDWDFDSAQYFNNPVLSSTVQANSYFGRVGVQNVDENETDNAGLGDGPPAAHAYRTNDLTAAGLANDVPRQNFLDAAAGNPDIKDYGVSYFNSGEWVNYTRSFPAGKYNVYGRLANGNSGTATVYFDQVTAGRGTATQTVVPLGRFSFTARGWSTYDFVPLRDQFGNLATLDLNGVATLRARAGGANINFFMLIPARMDLPTITEVYPDGTTLLQGTNKLVFTAANPTVPISASGVQVTLNGLDVSQQLTLSGSSASWKASLPLVPNSTNVAVLKVTDDNGTVATTTVRFDTFSRTSFTWEAEDWDFDGGQFIDNPEPTAVAQANSYFGRISVTGVDQSYVTWDGQHVYRPDDYLGTEVCNDTLCQRYVTAQQADPLVRNYDLGWWYGSSWINYTRTYPAGSYHVYGRLSGGGAYTIQLDNYVAGVSNHVGQFSTTGRGWGTYDWVPLQDAAGQKATVTLGGVSTVRLTTGGGANANFYLLVPALPAPAAGTLAATATATHVNLSFASTTGYSYQVQYKDDLSDAAWKVLTVVAGDDAVKTVSDPTTGGKRFYRLQVQ